MDADQRRVEAEERATIDRRYRAAREKLAQASRLGPLIQITARVAHKINQPVAAIRTFAESGTILLTRGAPDATRETLGRVVGLADRVGANQYVGDGCRTCPQQRRARREQWALHAPANSPRTIGVSLSAIRPTPIALGWTRSGSISAGFPITPSRMNG